MKKNPFVYSTISSLAGTGVYALVKYLLINQFDILTTSIIFVVFWIGNFISYKLMRRKRK